MSETTNEATLDVVTGGDTDAESDEQPHEPPERKNTESLREQYKQAERENISFAQWARWEHEGYAFNEEQQTPDEIVPDIKYPCGICGEPMWIDKVINRRHVRLTCENGHSYITPGGKGVADALEKIGLGHIEGLNENNE